MHAISSTQNSGAASAPAAAPVWDPATRLMLHAATLAPSSHNTQPWRFVVRPGEIELHADPTRALPVNDPHDRELTVSCGCALFNLRSAAAHCGLAARVARFPAGEDGELLARIELSAPHADEQPEASALAALYGSIAARRTYRKRFEARAPSERARQALAAAAQAEGARWCELHDDASRAQAAALIARGDEIQWSDARWRRELAAWMHPRRSGDGLTVPGLSAPLTHAIVRSFDMGHGVGAKDQELAQASPLLGVLLTRADARSDWLAAGEALQRILLTACGLGLQASFLNQPCQVEELRPQLAQLCGGDVPQLLVRLGFPLDSTPATVRRALEDLAQ